MQPIFTSAEAPPEDRYRRWREFTDQHFMPMVHTKLGEGAFNASLAGTSIGDLAITRTHFDALALKATAQTIRHPDSKADMFGFNLKIAGNVHIEQDGRQVAQGPGDFAIYDFSRPFTIVHAEPVEQLIIQIPRARLESMLGPSRAYTALTMHGHLPTTAMLRSFLDGLLRVGERLAPAAADRMAVLCIDLIAASIAERMALEVPKPLQGTIIVQRAKSHIEQHLGDPRLDPPRVAAAVGVSQRHLHALFRRHGRTVAAWIWQRRLEAVAQRLSDPATAHVAIGALAYGCGFADQTHFSRRFRERYGMSARDFRHAAAASRDEPQIRP